MSSLPSVVLPFRSPGASHEEALNVPPMTHKPCDACHKICDSMLQFVGHVCHEDVLRRPLCSVSQTNKQEGTSSPPDPTSFCDLGPVWFFDCKAFGIRCPQFPSCVKGWKNSFCLHVSLKSDLSSQSVIEIGLHSGALVPYCHPELYSIYQIHPVEESLVSLLAGALVVITL